MRRVCVLPAAAAFARFASDAKPLEKKSKMGTLHKILTGEMQFKNKALVKECNVELMFGSNWKSELEAYAAALSAEEKAVITRQVARLALTRYTMRELSMFAGNGPAAVDDAAQKYMISEGVKLLVAKGESEFTKHVFEEAKISNWSDDTATKFVASVKKAKSASA